MKTILVTSSLILAATGAQEPAFVDVPAAAFRMGADGDRDFFNESPAHEVALSAFRIGATEVTVEELRAFRPDFETTPGFEPLAAGVSWEEATAYCAWRSAREGVPYRLPTEAEWEHVARNADALGVRNVLTGVREWCSDWYGPYPSEAQVDPVGPAAGLTKVVRGGLLDDPGRLAARTEFDTPTSRASMPPAFGRMPGDATAGDEGGAGLVGTWFGDADLTRPQERERILRLDSSWINDVKRGRAWSARWYGALEAPITGPVTLELSAASGARLALGEDVVLDAWERGGTVGATFDARAGERYPIELRYARRGGETFLKLRWSHAGAEPVVVPPEALSHSAADARRAGAEGAPPPVGPGAHAIGFRVVQGAAPETPPRPEVVPYARRGVRQDAELARLGPPADRPYFRKRHLLPTPPDNASGEEIDALGLGRALRGHLHSPALEVCPNGDVLLVVYTSYAEYEPGVPFVASRLRFGADRWDFPEVLVDCAGSNDHAPLLWTDWSAGRFYLFWGAPRLIGASPFQWTSSDDSGATWAPVRFPRFSSTIGPHSRQPINTAVRTADGAFYLPSDGDGGTSVLWESTDGMETWRDNGARTAGRHTTIALFGDGRTIVGMGGKNTDIDGWMPRATTRDGGRSYAVSKTPFPAQGTNQRPSLLRLASGRLVFAADWQHFRGQRPAGVEGRGSYVAYSDDDGETWRFRTLPGAQPHESPRWHDGAATLGYSAMRQAPNGMIHLIGTMTRPCLHFELNEAWLEAEEPEAPAEWRSDDDAALMANTATRVDGVEKRRETLADGTVVEVEIGRADDGRRLLHGVERWTGADGTLQREARYALGRPVGTEIQNDAAGRPLWRAEHGAETSTWTRYRDGRPYARSTWRELVADGPAELLGTDGAPTARFAFERGRMVAPGAEPLFPSDGVPAEWLVRAWNDVREPARGAPVWRVTDAVLVGGEPRGSWLLSEREYDDFELWYEFRLGARGNSGLALRAPLAGDPAFDGLELQMADVRYNPEAKDSELTGGLYRAVAPSAQVYRPTDWNRMHVVCRGARVTAELNDEPILDVDLDAQTASVPRHDGTDAPPLRERPRRGHVGFQELSRDGGHVEIRGAWIRVLK